jgi:hypothetical protein
MEKQYRFFVRRFGAVWSIVDADNIVVETGFTVKRDAMKRACEYNGCVWRH